MKWGRFEVKSVGVGGDGIFWGPASVIVYRTDPAMSIKWGGGGGFQWEQYNAAQVKTDWIMMRPIYCNTQHQPRLQYFHLIASAHIHIPIEERATHCRSCHVGVMWVANMERTRRRSYCATCQLQLPQPIINPTNA